MKKILIIAYWYPPFNNGGVQRILNFKKYLPRYGYQVDIVTSNDTGKFIEKEEFVYRYKAASCPNSTGKIKKGTFSIIFLNRLMVFLGLRGDAILYWKKEVLNKISEDIDVSSYDYILASFPPQTNLEIGEELSKRYNIPLIIDYRDGLLYNPFPIIKISPFQKIRARNLEKRLAKHAILHVAVNSAIGDYFRNEYHTPTIDIPNGFDDEEIFTDSNFELPKGFNIVYTGSLSLSRKTYSIDQISRIIESNSDTNFVFIGKFSKSELQIFTKYKNVFVYKQLERKKIIPIQRKADMLLLVTGDEPSAMTGKLFEYLFSQTPILNLGRNNIGSKIIEETNSGKSFHPKELESIHDFISKVRKNEIQFKYVNLEKYTRREQCRRLANYLDNFIYDKRHDSL